MLTQLKHLNTSGTFPSGNPRFYYRPKGQKGIATPDLPQDHPGFLAAYARAAGDTPRPPVLYGSVAFAVRPYVASDAFRLGLADSTRGQRRRMLDEIAESATGTAACLTCAPATSRQT